MTRKEFMRLCTTSCLAVAGMAIFTDAAGAAKKVWQEQQVDNKITVDKQEFIRKKRDKIIYRKYIIVTNPAGDYPIVLYRFEDDTYAALLMQCTHQGSELSVQGDVLTCPAHGSEFSNKGEVISGPAEQNLITFTVTSDETNIYIHTA